MKFSDDIDYTKTDRYKTIYSGRTSERAVESNAGFSLSEMPAAIKEQQGPIQKAGSMHYPEAALQFRDTVEDFSTFLLLYTTGCRAGPGRGGSRIKKPPTS